nr:ribosome recycling factor [Lachnospiraceae bacterium]
RRDANDTLKKAGKEEDLSEDEIKNLETEVQKMTDSYIAKIDGAIENKTKEIMTV